MKQIEHKATIITARYSSNCPYCGFRVNPGEKCKVYSDQWYHMNCWEKKFSNVVDDRKDKEIEYLKNTIEHLNDVMYRASKHLLTAHQIIEEER